MTDFELLSIERAGAVATVTLQRPDKLNALNARVIEELARAFTSLSEAAEPVRAAVVTGAGKAFAAGADIAAMASMTPVEAKRFSEQGQALFAQMEASRFPIIAAVHGFALGGGCELALACDFIYAAEGTKLGLPEVTLAVIPGFGGAQRLLRRVGNARARELVYTGDLVTADQALAMGLVNAVVPAADLLARVHEVAQKIASRGPLAVASAKRAISLGEGTSLGAGVELEGQSFASLFGSDDQRAGMKAFLEKGKAVFIGK